MPSTLSIASLCFAVAQSLHCSAVTVGTAARTGTSVISAACIFVLRKYTLTTSLLCRQIEQKHSLLWRNL